MPIVNDTEDDIGYDTDPPRSRPDTDGGGGTAGDEAADVTRSDKPTREE